LDIVRETTEKLTLIRGWILAAQSWQKSYTDLRRKPLEFQVGDFVMLKVSPMKGVRRFSRKGKLAPRYVGPFRVNKRIRVVYYRLDVPASMASVHDVFHISMLRKHLRDEEQQRLVDVSDLDLQSDINTVEHPFCILAREEKRLRNKVIPLVKVQWNRHNTEEASWKRKEDMRRDYPQLFEEEVYLVYFIFLPVTRKTL
jgi:hypothetical protein